MRAVAFVVVMLTKLFARRAPGVQPAAPKWVLARLRPRDAELARCCQRACSSAFTPAAGPSAYAASMRQRAPASATTARDPRCPSESGADALHVDRHALEAVVRERRRLASSSTSATARALDANAQTPKHPCATAARVLERIASSRWSAIELGSRSRRSRDARRCAGSSSACRTGKSWRRVSRWPCR